MLDISLKNLEKYYGDYRVLESITFDAFKGDKIGVVGLNGSGKTTLLKVLCSTEDYESGELFIREDASIGYLAQLTHDLEKFKVIDILCSAFDNALKIKSKMEELEKLMGNSSENQIEYILEEYGTLQEEFECNDGYNIEQNIKYVSMGLNINEEMQNRFFSTLSGGEKTTVLLAKLLLQKPQILLLDEPSNHLDKKSIKWLGDFLLNYEGTVILISHDKAILNKVVKTIIEIELGVSSIYKGNYSYYVNEKRNRYRKQVKLYTSQQKKIQSIKKTIIRLRTWEMKGGSGKFYIKAASMQKMLNRMNVVKMPSRNNRKIDLKLSVDDKPPEKVLEVVGISKTFGNRTLFNNLNLEVMFGEKLAIIGKNGVGKSTLANIIMNQCECDKGLVKLGSEVRLGYLPQNVTFSDENATVLDAFREELHISYEDARRSLAKFLFTKDSVFKKVNTLSGGERSRLRLCKFMELDINLLILDEPTNHFDINSKEVLQKSLKNYNGTIICISHDRAFINSFCERVLVLTDTGLK